MSEENVELLYRSIDAISRRDLEAFMALMDQGVQAVPRIVTVEGRLRGHEGIRQWWDTWLDAFPDWKVEVVGVRDDREGHRPAARGPALAARLGITTALTVPLMTWVVMPRVTRLLRGWLYPEREVP